MTRKGTVCLVAILLIFAALFALAAPTANMILGALQSTPVSVPPMRGWVGVFYLLALLILLILGICSRGGVPLIFLGVYALICLALCLLGVVAMVTPVFLIGFLLFTLAGFLILPIFTLYAYLVPAMIVLAVLLLSAAALFCWWYIRPWRAKKKEKERLWQEERRKRFQQLDRQGKGGL